MFNVIGICTILIQRNCYIVRYRDQLICVDTVLNRCHVVFQLNPMPQPLKTDRKGRVNFGVFTLTAKRLKLGRFVYVFKKITTQWAIKKRSKC